jgi:hypothetical protein
MQWILTNGKNISGYIRLQGSILRLNSRQWTKKLPCASKIHGTGHDLAIKYYIYKTDALKKRFRFYEQYYK